MDTSPEGFEVVTVHGRQSTRIEYQGAPVITLTQISQIHEKSDDSARAQFNRHKNRFIQGKDYFVADNTEAIKLIGRAAPNGLTLLTVTGYLKIAKTFTDDLSWDIQSELIDVYFKKSSTQKKEVSNLDMFRIALAAMEDASKSANQAISIAHTAETIANKVSDRVERIESVVETRNDYCTVAGYCQIHRIHKTMPEISGLGRRCKKESVNRGYEVKEIFDPRWGKVGLYHMNVLRYIVGQGEA